MMNRTIPKLFEDSVSKFAENSMVWEKTNGIYEKTTYREMRRLVQNFAGGLLSLGLHRGDRAALLSEGRKSWILAELGLFYTGAVSVPISVKVDELSDLKFRLSHSGCRMIIVSALQSQKIQQIKNDLPELEKIILLDARNHYDEDEIFIGDALQRGETYLKEHEHEFEAIWKSVDESDIATIGYTSGTTADPKGVVLTHRNYTANVEQSSSLMPILANWVTLLILPWDHSFAHTAGLYTMICHGASFASVKSGRSAMETLKNIPENIREIKPHFLLSVPALAKNFRKNIEKSIKEKGPRLEKLFNHALNIAYAYNGDGWNRGKGTRIIYKPLYMIYDKLIFSKVREGFGGRLQFFIGGGAYLDVELQRFFYAIGIPMLQGYGLSEAAPVISSNAMHRHKLGTSGFLVEDLQLKICDEQGRPLPVGQKGEIAVKGENVMSGYWRNKTATDAALKDGWLFTGDLGYMDNEGFLYVSGRSKSLLIGNDGEKYSPEAIEEALTEQSAYIDQIMLYNNQSPYTVALIVPNKLLIRDWLSEHQFSLRAPEGQQAIIKLIDDQISLFRDGGRFARTFPTRWLPACFAILGEGFTEQNHMINSTLKMVRGRITEYYQNRLDFMYTAEGKDIFNHQNLKIISRFDVGE
jgi:long-chain acyl-CoA synthetase